MTPEFGQLLARNKLTPAERPPGFEKKTTDELCDDLERLYRSAMERHTDPFLERHSQPNSIRRQVEVFQMYSDYLPVDGTILDWGCKHAPDSYLMRRLLGDGLRLHGYDFDRGDAYQSFYEAADLEFRQAEHPFLLPYEDESMDAVLGSGVLEHAALPSRSLAELYRVVKVGGLMAITFLPNHLSWTEFLLRNGGSKSYHRRPYSPSMIKRLLLDHGFEPQAVGYHQFVPAQRGGRLAEQVWSLNRPLEKAIPTKYFCANIYALAVKRRAI